MNFTLKNKFYQMFILGLNNQTLNDNIGLKVLLEKGLGGVIFFSQNIKTEEQFKKLIGEIKAEALISPFLGIDQEGGKVERTENIYGGKKFISPQFAFRKGEDFLKKQTEVMLQELKDFGINLNFAPCLDVNTNSNNPIIDQRAFSSKPDEVIKAFNIVKDVYDKLGIISCVKHFPGHGDADKDSHLELPEINLTKTEMENIHIKPFKFAIDSGVKMVMVAHLHCKCFDEEKTPSLLSKKTMNYLREKLNFSGVVISDDMFMKGIDGFSPKVLAEAIKNDVNMFIYRNSEENTLNFLESVYQLVAEDIDLRQKVENSFNKITELKKAQTFLCSC